MAINQATADSYLRFTRRDWLIGLLIILLAFSYRVIIIVDRAQSPSAVSAFDPLPPGSDQLTYYKTIQTYVNGDFPPTTFFYQPGPSYLMVALYKLMNTDNLGALRIAVAAFASINCGLMIAVARLAFGKKWVSYLAGVLLALYPVSAFYDTDFVITSQSTILVTIALFGIFWLWRQPRNWTGAVLFGLSVGVLALMRRELIVVAPVMGLLLLWKERSWRTLFQVSLAAVLAILVTLPVILHNRAGGADYMITPVGLTEIYRGNNRDADGTYGGKQASQTTDADYLHFLWQDVMLVPGRFIELQLHKIGLYLSSSEPGNNLNYVLSGKNVSPALGINPLNFSLLLVLFLVGIWGGFRRGANVVWLLGLLFLVMMASTMLIWIEARLRTPVIVVMIPTAALGIIYVFEHLPQHLRPINVQNLRLRNIPGWATPIILIALVLLFSTWAEHDLPRPLTVTQLPHSALPTNAIYDDTLQLLGWQVQEQYSRAGIIQPFHPYVVSLYWKLLKPTTVNYSFSLADYIDGERVLGFDYPIGLVAYPDHPTSSWQTDTIYVEHVGLTYKQFDGPIGINGELLLYVYPERDAESLLSAVGLERSPTFIRLTQPAIMIGNGLFETLSLTEFSQPFGDSLLLKSWRLPETAKPNQSVPITLGWQTTSTPICCSYSIGIYVFSSAGEFITQVDSPPRDGRLLTSSLPVNYLIEDTKSLTMPDKPDTYTLYVGVYDNNTSERLVVSDTTDNLVKIGEIEVTE